MSLTEVQWKQPQQKVSKKGSYLFSVVGQWLETLTGCSEVEVQQVLTVIYKHVTLTSTEVTAKAPQAGHLVIYFYLYNLVIPCRKCGPSYLGKATAAARAALPSPKSACWVFWCLCNPPNPDMDYRIFNVCTWSFLCLQSHAHRNWVHWQRVNLTFFTSQIGWQLLPCNPPFGIVTVFLILSAMIGSWCG